MLIDNFNNCDQLLLQVTEACQFDCKYCFYGEMYHTNTLHSNKKMTKETALAIVKNCLINWNNLCGALKLKTFYIGFYGGEPLLNFDLINKVVSFTKKNIGNIRIQFNLTTNGYLLSKYIDFFIENNFEILISLDGCEKANIYRVLKNGNETFNTVISCCDMIKQKNLECFTKNISFNSVFTSQSTIEEVIKFFYKKYTKFPMLTVLSTVGVQKEREGLFNEMYTNLLQETHKYFIEKEDTLYKNTNNAINDQILDFFRSNDLDFLSSLLGSISRRTDAIRNGTCTPFFKKMFIDVDGNILPCEKLGNQVVLGKIREGVIYINYDEVLERFNILISKSTELCKNCFNATTCNQCIYSCFDNNKCSFYSDLNQGKKNYTSLVKILEFYRKSLDYYMD